MTNNIPVDKLKPFLAKERTRLILLAAKEGLNFADVARIFRVDKSMITRVISNNMEAYKQMFIPAPKGKG